VEEHEQPVYEDGELSALTFGVGGLIAVVVGVVALVLMAGTLIWMAVDVYG
jgi:hypothetical protein